MLRPLIVASCVLVAVAAAPAAAFSNGQFDTGEGTSSCRRCHGTNAPVPAVTVTDASGAALSSLSLVENATIDVFLTVRRDPASTGLGAGFAVSTDTAGTPTVQ